MRTLWKKIERAMSPPPLDKVVAARCRHALTEAAQAAHTIRTHEFLRHMALAELHALDDYRAGRILKADMEQIEHRSSLL